MDRLKFENAYLGDRSSRDIVGIVIRAGFHEDVSCRPVTTEIPVGRVVVLGIIIVACVLGLEELIRQTMCVAPAYLVCQACSWLGVDSLLCLEFLSS